MTQLAEQVRDFYIMAAPYLIITIMLSDNKESDLEYEDLLLTAFNICRRGYSIRYSNSVSSRGFRVYKPVEAIFPITFDTGLAAHTTYRTKM